MKFFILLFILNTSYAQDSARAMDKTKEAIMASKEYQLIQKNISTKIEKTINIPKEYVTPIASVTITLVKGKFDTKFFKYSYTMMDGILRPDALYDLRNKEIKGMISINWGF